MSDDTPTQKFDPMGDAPTEVIGGAPVLPGDPAATEPAENGKSRRLLIILASVGGALLLAVLILLVLLLTRGTGAPAPSASPTPTPTPSSTPSETPSPTPTPTASSSSPAPSAAPEETGPRFTSFNAPAEISGCSMGTQDFTPPKPLLKVSWSTAGATEAWFVMGDSDAADSGFMQIPLSGNQNDFSFPIEFGCSSDSYLYTITLVGPGGEHVQKHWTVRNTGEKF